MRLSLLLLVMPLLAQDWWVYRPKLRSQTTALTLPEAQRLLPGVCDSLTWEDHRSVAKRTSRTIRVSNGRGLASCRRA